MILIYVYNIIALFAYGNETCNYITDQKNAGSVCQAQRGFTSNNYHKRNKGPVVQDHVLLLPIELPSTVFTQQCESELKFLNYTKVFILPSNNYVLI